ncbi:dockerin type I repeat-containing protein [Candidatus Saccharibacteria bacterium]|nr:dockerin type I repeat-containing protein [Candidatus Saccharibacteria bacterium]
MQKMKANKKFRLWGRKRFFVAIVSVVLCTGTFLAVAIYNKSKDSFADIDASVEDDIAVARRIAKKAKIVEEDVDMYSTMYYAGAAYKVVLPTNPLYGKGKFSYKWYLNGSNLECNDGVLKPAEEYCRAKNYGYGEISADIYYEYDDNGTTKKVLLTETSNDRPKYTSEAAEISYDFVGKDNSGNTKFIFLNNPEAISVEDITDGYTGKYIYKTSLKKNTEFYFEHNRDGNPSSLKFFYGIKLWNGSGSQITVRFNRSGVSATVDGGAAPYAKVWEEYYRYDGMVERREYTNGVWQWFGLQDKSTTIEAGETKYIWLVRDDSKRGNAKFILTGNDSGSLNYLDANYAPTSDSWAFDGVLNMTITGGDATKVHLVAFAAKDGSLSNFAEGNNNQLGSLSAASYKGTQHTGEYDGLPEVKANIEYDISNNTSAGTLKTYYSTTSDETDLKLINGWVTNITGERAGDSLYNRIAAYQRELIPLKLPAGLPSSLGYGYDTLRPFEKKIVTANYITRYYDVVTINNTSDKPRTVAYFINTASGTLSTPASTTLAAFVQRDDTSSGVTFANGYDGDVFRPIENYTVANGTTVTRINNARVSVTRPTFESFSFRTNIKVWSAEIQPGGSVTIPAVSLMGGMSFAPLVRRICIDNVCEEPTYSWNVESGGTGGVTSKLGWDVSTSQVEPLTRDYSTCTVKLKYSDDNSFNSHTIRSNTDFVLTPLRSTFKFAGWSLNGDMVNLLPANYVFNCRAGETITIEEILGDIDSGVESVSFDGREYVVGINPGTKIENLDLGFKNSFQKFVHLSDRNGERGAPYIAVTGDIVEGMNIEYNGGLPAKVLEPMAQYNLVVTGDTTGDGVFSVSDVAKAYRHITNTDTMTGGDVLAGDANNDQRVSSNDVRSLYTSLRGLSSDAPAPTRLETKIGLGSVSISCDNSELKPGESTNCRINGHSDYAITSLKLDVSKMGAVSLISNYSVNSDIWQGTAEDGHFILYTNQNLTGDFSIGSFTVTVTSSANNGIVRTKNISFDGASDYKNYAVRDASETIDLDDSGDQPGGDQPGGDQPGGDQPGGNEPGGNEPGNEPGGDQPGGDQPGGNGPNNNNNEDIDVPNTASGDSETSAPYTGANTKTGGEGALFAEILLPIAIAGFIVTGYVMNRNRKHIDFGKK